MEPSFLDSGMSVSNGSGEIFRQYARFPKHCLLRSPLNPFHCVVEHQIKHVVALFLENDAVVAVGQMGIQHFLDCGLDLAL